LQLYEVLILEALFARHYMNGIFQLYVVK